MQRNMTVFCLLLVQGIDGPPGDKGDDGEPGQPVSIVCLIAAPVCDIYEMEFCHENEYNAK